MVGNTSLTCNEVEVAFIANFPVGGAVTAANDSSIWRGGNPGNLTLVAREGDVVPANVLAPSVNGPWSYTQINTGTNSPLLNGRGDMIFQVTVSDTVATKNVYLGSTATLGLQLLLDAGDTFTTSLGTSTWTTVSSAAGFNSADGGQTHFNNQGDFAVRPGLAAPGLACILRGHMGSLIAKPASISAVAGGTQNFVINCAAARAFNIYVVLGSTTGTRPGTPSPLGPQTIPLNFDTWTQLSLDLANTSVYSNSLGFLDANGKATASFNLPPAIPGVQGLLLHHAVVTLDLNLASTFVSEPTSLKLY